MPGNEIFDRAMTTVEAAVRSDNAGEYEKAYQQYCQALELFLHVIKYEKNPRTKEMLRGKTSEWMARTEKLKVHLDQQQGKTANGKNNGAKDGDKKNNDKDDDNEEAKKMRNALAGAILSEKPDVKWEDVAGLEQAKEALKEAVILPIKFPHLFAGNRKPWRGILLYGPPGTGKSFLAKAVATEAKSTFFSVSSSDLVSKWVGDSERLIKQLFKLARENKPSIIFIDEIDAICGPRGEGESESARRLKTEFLIQMDGVGNDMTGLLILGATNIPWQIDAAVRRRFQRRIHISLPDPPARRRMFEIAIGKTPCTLSAKDYKKLVDISEGYSGSDIAIAVQDALLAPVRTIQTATHYKQVTVEENKEDGSTVTVEKLTPCSPGDPSAIEMTWTDIEDGEKLLEPQLEFKHFQNAIKSVRPTVSQADLKEHQKWTQDFGSEGS